MKCIRCGKEMTNTIGGNYTCPECGFAINDLVYRDLRTAKPTNEPGCCDIPIPSVDWYNQGWICPKCGAVLAPSQSFCPFCSPNRKNNIVYATGTGEFIQNPTQTISVEWTDKDILTKEIK